MRKKPVRGAIALKSDITEIYNRTAAKLGVKPGSVNQEISTYWIDIDIMFTHCCGYGTYVEKFGHFIIYTNGVVAAVKNIEKIIGKSMKAMSYIPADVGMEKRTSMIAKVSELITRIILLNYSIELYKTEILATYPRKYKIRHYKYYQAAVRRVEKLFAVSLDEFPITINNPIQKVFVQSLRKKGILHHRVVDNLKLKGRKKKPDDTKM